jgi:hypothetical protein
LQHRSYQLVGCTACSQLAVCNFSSLFTDA